MLIQLAHEALAEGHDLPVGLTLGIKVGTALTAADGKTGERVLEYLLKTQELDDTQVDGRMEPQTALIGADGAVKLNTVAIIYLDLALVVYPGNTEQDLPLGGGQPLQKGISTVSVFISFDNDPQGVQHFLHSLMELGLGRILGNHPGKYFINVTHFSSNLSSLRVCF